MAPNFRTSYKEQQKRDTLSRSQQHTAKPRASYLQALNKRSDPYEPLCRSRDVAPASAQPPRSSTIENSKKRPQKPRFLPTATPACHGDSNRNIFLEFVIIDPVGLPSSCPAPDIRLPPPPQRPRPRSRPSYSNDSLGA
ncbi:hypothetical protein CSUB01_06777 [Colletotrichum sublineola]|uniref:Uncharacterized protein n=1 Tax=Colletotrichum sublineola TaxID=1173701 RepID=A0A066XQQ5_COLSU|nr:hypothetical protein CSUB01_06777 [Colletotrichum sublineola]